MSIFKVADKFAAKFAQFESGPPTEVDLEAPDTGPESETPTERKPMMFEGVPRTEPIVYEKELEPKEPEPITVHLTSKEQNHLREALVELYNKAQRESEDPGIDPVVLNLLQDLNALVNKLQLLENR